MVEHPNDLPACHRLIDELQIALESCDVIGQAKGILMALEGCDGDAAFAVLARASQRESLEVREMAAAVIATHCEDAGAAAHPSRATPIGRGTGVSDATSEQGEQARPRHLALVRPEPTAPSAAVRPRS